MYEFLSENLFIYMCKGGFLLVFFLIKTLLPYFYTILKWAKQTSQLSEIFLCLQKKFRLSHKQLIVFCLIKDLEIPLKTTLLIELSQVVVKDAKRK